MSKDKDLIERMNKKMSGADTCRYSESEVKDMNKNVSYKNLKNEQLIKDIHEILENRKKNLSPRKEPLSPQEGATYSQHINEIRYVSTDTSDSKDYTATYIYQIPPRHRDDFRLLYAKVNEVRLRMEKVMSSNDDVDYEYELIKYKEWLESIVK
jgi:hypothetical protein